MFNPQHYGLLFTAEHVRQAQKHYKRPPLHEAWSLLQTTSPNDPLTRLQFAGLRWRLKDEPAAWSGELAWFEAAAAVLPEDSGRQPAHMLILAQCVELLRDHPSMTADSLVNLLDWYTTQIQAMHAPSEDAPLADLLWMAALQAAYGVMLEDEDHVQTAAAVFRHTIDENVHPEGYLPRAVENRQTGSLEHQISAVHALILLAEITAHAGVDLWSYHNRGVSIMTAAIYPLYYYFYPEKWPWQQGGALTPETATGAFKARAGLLEILNVRSERPLKAVQLMLDECRPILDVTSGGLPTLTHGIPERRGLLG